MTEPTTEPRESTAGRGNDLEPEFGLFVLWPNGRSHEALVLDHLCRRFRVLEVTEVAWTPKLMSESYARFYRSRLVPPYRSSLLTEKGIGAALVIAVRDDHPAYAVRPTMGGARTVSVRIFDAKDELRGQLNVAAELHSADNPRQAAREYMLLVERAPADVIDREEWSGDVERLQRDLAGAKGWRDVRQMFSVLNQGGPYVVLRNFEGLEELALSKDHGDIDLLTGDYTETIALLGAKPRLRSIPSHGGRFDVVIGSRTVICDIRFVGDDYYDPTWARRILDTRRPHPGGFFVPDDDEHFDSLLYHALVHKPAISPDYRARLARMAAGRGRRDPNPAPLTDDEARMLLAERLTADGHAMPRPKDPTVFFNHRAAGSRAPRLRRLLDAMTRRAYALSLGFVQRPLRVIVLGVRESLLLRLPSLRRLGRRLRAALRP